MDRRGWVLGIVLLGSVASLGCTARGGPDETQEPDLDSFMVTVVNLCLHELAIQVAADKPDLDAPGSSLAPDAVALHRVDHDERVWRQGADGWYAAAWCADPQPGGRGFVELRCGS